MFSRGGPVLSEAKRDRARHAQRAERSGGLQGRSPPENFAKIEVF